LVQSQYSRKSVVRMVDPSLWQDNATGLSVHNNQDLKTSGLGFIIQVENWPSISVRGGVKGTGYLNEYILGPIGIDLGEIKFPKSKSVSLSSENVDWAHNEISFSTDIGIPLTIWASRISPAILIQSSSDELRLLSGDVTRNTFDGKSINSLSDGPSFPKYIAYSSGGSTLVHQLTNNEFSLPILDQNWLLLWYGSNSHFIDTKMPLTYVDNAGWSKGVLSSDYAYQADVPLLLSFQHQPSGIKHSPEGGIDLIFPSSLENVTLLPILGREHLNIVETEKWADGLPDSIIEKVQWWSTHLCDYPVGVNETYNYDEINDIVSITENINNIHICDEGSPFAFVPPAIGLSRNELNISFSGPVIDSGLYTEFGPTLGVDNSTKYTWYVKNLGKYVDAKRIIVNSGFPPTELEQEFVHEVNKILNINNHFAPWIFASQIPTNDWTGDVYWLNPADVIYHLVEISEVLQNAEKEQLINYIRNERITYPPEDVYNLPLGEGFVRSGFSVAGQDVYQRVRERRPNIFLDGTSLYNYYALAKYYESVGDSVSSVLWQKALVALDNTMAEQDWATFYWFDGFDDPKSAVINANRLFAGLVGFTKLASLVGTLEEEILGRALLAKAAVLRIGMLHYPRYLYESNLLNLPPEPDWQPRYTANNPGNRTGYIFNYSWTDPMDDARQVALIDQFGVFLSDHSDVRSSDPYDLYSTHLTAYRDMVPELYRLLSDFASDEATIYAEKIESLFPNWYVAFAEGMLGQENNVNHPADSFQIFMYKALIQSESPQQLISYVDIPWLHEGDLFYIHKLAEAIRVFRGSVWNDSLPLWGLPGDEKIELSWDVYVPLPDNSSWTIEYQGQTGDQSSPIADIPVSFRNYTLSGLNNNTYYTVTLKLMLANNILLTSKPIVVMPRKHAIFIPLITNGQQ